MARTQTEVAVVVTGTGAAETAAGGTRTWGREGVVGGGGGTSSGSRPGSASDGVRACWARRAEGRAPPEVAPVASAEGGTSREAGGGGGGECLTRVAATRSRAEPGWPAKVRVAGRGRTWARGTTRDGEAWTTLKGLGARWADGGGGSEPVASGFRLVH